MGIAVGLLTYNRPELAIKTIKSLLVDNRQLSRIFVFDDGSDIANIQRISDFCSNHSIITIIGNRINQGYQKNLQRAMKYLSRVEEKLVFICESDMLLSRNWADLAIRAFELSSDSVALSVMLHRDQLEKFRSLIFKERCLTGYDARYPHLKQDKFGDECYVDMPDSNKNIKMLNTKIIYVSNGVGSIILKTKTLKNICLYLDDMSLHPMNEDAWMHYMCFKVNNYKSRSIMALDPGLALTHGGGMHGAMHLNNVRWMGNILWRNTISAATMVFVMRVVYYLFHFNYFLQYIVKKFKKKYNS